MVCVRTHVKNSTVVDSKMRNSAALMILSCVESYFPFKCLQFTSPATLPIVWLFRSYLIDRFFFADDFIAPIASQNKNRCLAVDKLIRRIPTSVRAIQPMGKSWVLPYFKAKLRRAHWGRLLNIARQEENENKSKRREANRIHDKSNRKMLHGKNKRNSSANYYFMHRYSCRH